MSSAQIAARFVKQLEPDDISVLRSLQHSLLSHETAPLPVISRMTGLHRDQTLYRLDRLYELGLVNRQRGGYVVVTRGLDAIALHAMVARGLISGLGSSLGVGKESDVYEAFENSSIYAIKFFRIGRTSFRAVRRSRSYGVGNLRYLAINVRAAAKEYKALEKLYQCGVAVPKPIARESHAILMAKIIGQRLSDLRKLAKPNHVISDLLMNIRKAYLQTGLISGDLSEFNVLSDGVSSWIIDWPQLVGLTHPNASTFLEKDIGNILKFFRRRFGLDYDQDAAEQYVKGMRKSLSRKASLSH